MNNVQKVNYCVIDIVLHDLGLHLPSPLREECRPRMCENKVLKKIFGTVKD
jgi:hypothetical protein